MGKSSKAPKPPDPQQTSAAQTGTSIGTAVANTMLGNVNQVSADGSTLSYDQTGSYTYRDPFTGQSYDIPTFTATEQLSDTAQGIYDTNQQAEQNLANIASNQSGFLQDYLSEPADFSNSATSDYLYDLGASRLDPRLAREQEQLESRLANQGVVPGSDAWNAEMRTFNEGRNDAYNSLLLNGNAQAVQQMAAQRNQPINEITALLSGSQVSMPNFAQNTPSSIPTTDVAGLINSNYNQQLGAWQQNQSRGNQVLGGLFGLGAGALSGGYL